MTAIYGYCGYRCDLCPAFVRNQKGPEDRQKVSRGWDKYLGFHMEPESILCDGCPFDGCHLDGGCKVRPCAVEKGYATCVECADADSCEKLKGRMDAIAPYKNRHGNSMSEEDYRLFIAPYESDQHLAQLRQQRRK